LENHKLFFSVEVRAQLSISASKGKKARIASAIEIVYLQRYVTPFGRHQGYVGNRLLITIVSKGCSKYQQESQYKAEYLVWVRVFHYRSVCTNHLKHNEKNGESTGQ
jgi:putative transposon-encoded protein